MKAKAALRQHRAWVVVPDTADNSWMTHPSAVSTVAASALAILLVFVVLQLVTFMWPRSLADKIKWIRRQWHPRTPDDCPQCWLGFPPQPADLVEITPWKATRSPRGARKRLSSEGVSCPNPECVYCGCTVESIHAMVACGVRGKTDAIRRWKCQACSTSVSERKFTPPYHLKTPPSRIFLVMALLANGLDPSAAARVFRHDHRTISRWLTRGGKHASALHDLFFQRLRCSFLQLDELVANIRRDDQRTFVWTAVDAITKIIPHVHVGRRLITDAYAFVHGLTQRLAPGHVPIFSSDGLRHYFSALTAHYGFWCDPAPGKRKRTWRVDPRLLFGMLYKVKVGRKLKELYSRIRCGTRKHWRQRTTAPGFSGQVQTAFVDRANLTLRELIAPLAHRTWSISRSHESLLASIYWGLCSYHFIRPHHSLRLSPACGRTPAMAARLTDHVWSSEEVLRYRIRFA
jgi:IS1 family transposase/transposase-like protein